MLGATNAKMQSGWCYFRTPYFRYHKKDSVFKSQLHCQSAKHIFHYGLHIHYLLFKCTLIPVIIQRIYTYTLPAWKQPWCPHNIWMEVCRNKIQKGKIINGRIRSFVFCIVTVHILWLSVLFSVFYMEHAFYSQVIHHSGHWLRF